MEWFIPLLASQWSPSQCLPFFLPISVGKAVSPQLMGTRDHKGNDEASSQSLFGLLMEPSKCKSIVSSLNPFLCWLRICTWRAKLCCGEQVSPQSSGSLGICWLYLGLFKNLCCICGELAQAQGLAAVACCGMLLEFIHIATCVE